MPRVLFIVGPTSSGKTSLGIALAKKFKGEIVNADARQVYKDFNIGTGKPPEGEWGRYQRRRAFLVQGVPHYLMDFLPPTNIFTVADWRQKAMKAIRFIKRRGHLPMVVGGTGLYVQALIDNYKIPAVPPQPSFRQAMEAKPLDELTAMLKRLDPKAGEVVDLKNRRRVLRALEVITFTGQKFSALRGKARSTVEPLLVGLARSKEELHRRIDESVEYMVEHGWVDEIRRLREQGIAWDAPAMTSIGYRELGAYVRGECLLEEAIAKAKQATRQYAKRQMTWFKRDQRIIWVKSEAEAKRLVGEWLGALSDPRK